jgi:NTP pyrophosphatase (non-canonical NTP hydrolase)
MINNLANEIHQYAVDKGFWEHERNDGECIALMHSELSEALEALRHGNPQDEHCPEFTNAEIELADCIIRILDTCAAWRFDIEGAIIAKIEFNKTRPHKHNKKF